MTLTIDVAQIITALAALLGAAGTLATVLIGLSNRRISRRNATGIAETKAKVDEVHDATNGLAARVEQTAERKAEDRQ